MTVTFHHPPVPHSTNPFVDFNPTNPAHYPDGNGVYIYGLRLNIKEGEEQLNGNLYKTKKLIENEKDWKFVPLYTGIAYAKEFSLRNRLYKEHYIESGTGGKSKKEMFDFSLDEFTYGDIISRYSDMGYYDLFLKERASKLNKYGKLEKINKIRHLIWFQNLVFYFKRFNVPSPLIKHDKNQWETIAPNGEFANNFDYSIYPSSFETSIDNIRELIIATKARFNDHFYFVYAQFRDVNGSIIETDIKEKANHDLWKKYKNDDETFLNGIEHATKKALKKLFINTTADSNGKTKAEIIIDLSKVQDKLVNLVNPNYTPYTNPLIIPFKP